MHTLKVKVGECSLFLYSVEKQMHTDLEQMVTEIIFFGHIIPLNGRL